MITDRYGIALFFTRIAIIWTALLPIFFNELIAHLFFLSEAKQLKRHRIILMASGIVTALFIAVSQTNLNIKDITMGKWGLSYIPGVAYYLLFFYLLLTFGFSFFNLLVVFRKYNNPQKSQAKLILIGSFVTVVLSICLDIVFPIVGNGGLNVYAPSTTIIFIALTAIAVSRHHLFNIKVITVELITCSLWIFLLVRTIQSRTSTDILINGGVFLATLIIGIFIIRTVLHEMKQRQQLETMAEDLKKAYSQIKELNTPPSLP